MKNSDEAIERVMAGLGDTAAPEGMEHRILKAVEDRAAMRSRSGWLRLRPVWLMLPVGQTATGSLAWGVALVCVIAMALAIPAARRFGHAPAESRAGSPAIQTAAQTAIQTAAQLSVGATPKPVRGATLSSAASGVIATRAGLHSPEPGSRAKAAHDAAPHDAAVHDAAGTDRSADADAVALSDTRAASQPAPPLPLTEQERLLLRMVHRGDPVELAMLEPELQRREVAEGKAEVQRFFDPSTSRDNGTGENK